MNRKIVISAFTIFAVAAAVVGATTAFFSDTETSTGNTFAAGAIDLKIDNESYYRNVIQDGTYGTPDLSWDWDELTDHLFFDFADLKPGDWGEDTISIHVDDNDSWLCAAVGLTSDRDNDCTEPELTNDEDCAEGPNDNGDLARELNFIWWADDGDNVLEEGENPLSPAGALGYLGVGNTQVVALTDSGTNIFGQAGNPFPGGEGNWEHIGKGWCFGDIAQTSPPIPNNADTRPPVRGAGFTCNGLSVDNASQTDSTTLDVSFYAVQARNNPGFTCSEWGRSLNGGG